MGTFQESIFHIHVIWDWGEGGVEAPRSQFLFHNTGTTPMLHEAGNAVIKAELPAALNSIAHLRDTGRPPKTRPSVDLWQNLSSAPPSSLFLWCWESSLGLRIIWHIFVECLLCGRRYSRIFKSGFILQLCQSWLCACGPLRSLSFTLSICVVSRAAFFKEIF